MWTFPETHFRLFAILKSLKRGSFIPRAYFGTLLSPNSFFFSASIDSLGKLDGSCVRNIWIEMSTRLFPIKNWEVANR